MKLGERFLAENSNLSYADLHYKITKDAEEMWPNSQDDQKRTLRSMNKDDELVRYMSNLPSYLKRGETVKEKAYSIGVLDWECLEKWQHMHKRTVQRTSRYSTSSASTSSSHPTEASSSHSSRGRSCSPVNHRMHHPSVQPYPVASPDIIDRKTTKSTGKNAFAVVESKSLLDNHLCRAHVIHAADQTLKLWHGNKTEESKRRGLNSKMFRKIETQSLTHVKSDVGSSCLKEKAEVQDQDCGIEKTDERLRKSNTGKSKKLAERPNRVVMLLPRNIPRSGNFEVSQLPDPAASSKQNSLAGSSPGSTLGKRLDVHHLEFDSKFSKINPPISVGAGPTVLSSDVLCPLPVSARAPRSPCRSRNAEIRTSRVALVDDDAGKSSKGLDAKASEPSSEKVRSPSPFRRFSMSVGKIVKSYSSKEPVSSESSVARTYEKSCPEDLELSATTPARSRSSPLRRMLDPLLKPRESNCNYSDDPMEKNSEPSDRVSRSSEGLPDSSAVQLAKAKLDLTSCRSINVDKSYVEMKGGSSMVQALLRVTTKNDLPLFTFAVDNDGDILAATTKECNSSLVKDKQTWIYTFLMIREVKQKNGSWINQGGKGKRQDYVPNVVAQMKVSASPLSHLREFVLFSVGSRKQNLRTSEFQPNSELAAIVSQIPLKIYPCPPMNGHRGAVSNDLDQEPSVNMTVILPGGVHSLPSKGGPSSLIQRWRSGGSCDCGGWDLGCQLKVLSGDHHFGDILTPEAPSTTGHFELFPQVLKKFFLL